MNSIQRKARDINLKKQELKIKWINKMRESQEYQELDRQQKELIVECESLGHERGTFWDNGLGWSGYYCKNCGTIVDKECYLEFSSLEDE